MSSWEDTPPGDATPAQPSLSQEEALIDQVLDWMQTNVLRLIALRVVPLLVGSTVVTGVLAWVQDALGLDLPTEVVTALAFTMIAGVVAVAFTYVRNHAGAAKLGAVVLELLKVKAEGEKAALELEKQRQIGTGGPKRIA